MTFYIDRMFNVAYSYATKEWSHHCVEAEPEEIVPSLLSWDNSTWSSLLEHPMRDKLELEDWAGSRRLRRLHVVKDLLKV